MGETIKVEKSGHELIIAIPPSICEHMSLIEGTELEIEPFSCGGEMGARIKVNK